MNSLPSSFIQTQRKIIHKPGGIAPKGALFLGLINGQRLYLTRRDRSFHLLIIGAIGTGKTVTMEACARSDIDHGEGLCILDPMFALFERLLGYCCYRTAIGCRVGEVIVANFSSAEWILPFNPFLRREGELSVQVDRRVSATVRVWGVSNTDQTPRLEKWLKVIYSVLIASGLTVLEAGLLIDQHSQQIRAFLLQGLKDSIIRRKLEHLSLFKPSEFLEQTESVENRLLRFLTSEHLSLIFGTGSNALDFRSIMDQGKILLVNLQPSNYLSDEQARLLGTFLLNELYETALTRPTGAKPFYTYVDEAAKYVTPELAQATEQCRQKGLHFTFAFQHLAQFKQDGERVYKAFKHIRNKIVFAVPERQDALELADDLFVGLAEPQVKFLHRHLTHLIEDVQRTSSTQTHGSSNLKGSATSQTQTRSRTSGASQGRSSGHNESMATGQTFGRTFTRGKSRESGTTSAHSRSEHEAHTSGFSETMSRQRSSSSNTSETVYKKKSRGLFATDEEQGSAATTGSADNESSGYSRTDIGSDSYERGESFTESSNESVGASTSLAFSRTKQRLDTTGSSTGQTQETSGSTGRAIANSRSQNVEHGSNTSRSLTRQWGTKHTPFMEEDPEHWTLEEQRWRASELLMSQQLGHWFVRTASTVGFGSTALPRPFYLMPKRMLELTREFYQRHNLTPEQARDLVQQRQRQLLSAVAASSRSQHQAEASEPHERQQSIWNRATSDYRMASAPRKRGPKTDQENHAKVFNIVSSYGEGWTTGDNLLEICEALDRDKVPVPKTWPTRQPPARTWCRGLQNDPSLVIKAIKYHCQAVKADAPQPH